MKPVQAWHLVSSGKWFAVVYPHALVAHEIFPLELRTSLAQALEGQVRYLGEIGLLNSIKMIERIIRSFVEKEGLTFGEVKNAMGELERRLQDELEGISFLFIPPDKDRYWRQAALFGVDVERCFPSCRDDIEEAGNCLACGRSTAAVFHLMRVMEVALRVTGHKLGVPYAPSWESYLKQIKDKVDQKWKKKGIAWRKDEPFFREVLGLLHAVKIAWRNPTVHVDKDYTPEQAEDVFNAVGGFMRHLATKLKE